MKRFTMFACLALSLVVAINAFASDPVEDPEVMLANDQVLSAGSSQFTKAVVDTVVLIGFGSDNFQNNGSFQNGDGEPDWNGWTGRDLTFLEESQWHVSTYRADNLGIGMGNKALYCGDETIEPCSDTDPIGGYGNSWDERAQFVYTVDNTELNTTIDVTFTCNHDTEEGFDFVYMRILTAGGYVLNEEYFLDLLGSAVTNTYTYTYEPGDYYTEAGNQVIFEIQFFSDGAWSDVDCLFAGGGAVQVDDITTNITQNSVVIDTYFDDFEDTEVPMGNWVTAAPVATGDFAQLWQNLGDIEPCYFNYSPQVAFINDGTQVAGVSGSPGDSWLYGPGGYIVNNTGGAAEGIEANPILYNAIESPAVNWPLGYTGCNLSFDIYRHERLLNTAVDPGMFYTWALRTATSEVGLETAAWKDRNFVYYGGPDYYRASNRINDLITQGTTHAQVQLTCYELGANFGYVGTDGTPAPYFDHVRLLAHEFVGPGYYARELELAQDSFPENGEVVLGDPAQLLLSNVRFDMASSNELDGQTHNTAGDSLIVQVVSMRDGGELIENKLVWSLLKNPVFDAARTSQATTGEVDAKIVYNASRIEIPDRFSFDLPDTGFLFPGDRLHYYFTGTDAIGGVGSPETSTYPEDLTGFGDFSDPMAYNTRYQVNCLPSIDGAGNYAPILFWNDFANRGGEAEWYGALRNLGLRQGIDYDVYYTNSPTSDVGNGLGRTGTLLSLQNYSTLLYTAGDLDAYTISDGESTDGHSNDVGLLTNWFADYPVKALFTGDSLITGMFNMNQQAFDFTENVMGLFYDGDAVSASIGDQTAPTVVVVDGNPVFTTCTSWIAYGGCAVVNAFDKIEPMAGSGAERLAEFSTPAGGTGAYSFSAATLFENEDGNTVITMPYDLMYIYTDPDNVVNHIDGTVASRVHVLRDVLNYFGIDSAPGHATPVPGAEKFFARNYPNPFNPTTKIEFNMPKDGHLTLKIYNVRGELVRTLIDEARLAGSDHIMWDGTSDQGSSVSSGVYFYEARTAGEVQINKMALVK